MEEWKEYKLGDFMQFNPKEKIAKGKVARKIAMDQLVPYCRDVNSQIFEEYKGGAKFRNGDTIMARITPCLENGKTSYISSLEEGEVAFGSTEYIVLRHIENVSDSKFVYYLSVCPEIRNVAIKSMVGSSGRQRVQQDVLENYSMFLPSLPTQQKIANILSSLDDKIEVNRRINEQLEELAQALFKSWFVDFEPFKDGEFMESELGMIPEGWRVGTLGELIEIKYGKDHKKLNDGDIPVYGSGGIMRYVDKSLFEGESVLIPRKGTLNNVMYVNRDFWTVDTMFFSKMKVLNIAIFVYLFLSKKDLASMNSGSAVPSMTVDILNRIPLVIPNDKVFEDYNNIVSSLFAQMSNNSKEITHLTTLRDTLLPKLMSGEIDVNEVEI